MNCMRGRPLKHSWNARVPLPVLAAAVALTAASFALTSWAQVVGTPELQLARAGHTATLLADGRILIVGGETANGPVSRAEIFDPAAGGFSVTGSSVVARRPQRDGAGRWHVADRRRRRRRERRDPRSRHGEFHLAPGAPGGSPRLSCRHAPRERQRA